MLRREAAAAARRSRRRSRKTSRRCCRGPPDKAPANAGEPAQGPRARQGAGLRALVDPARREDGRGARGTRPRPGATTITYDPADINAENLQQYDGIFLASTTGTFLDDPTDPAATAARRKALLDFVRSGKGLAGIHAATDSYHGNPANAAGRRRRRRPTRPGRSPQDALAAQLVAAGDTNADQKLSKDEFSALADSCSTSIDPSKTGKVAQADFAPRFAAALPQAAPGAGRGGGAGGAGGERSRSGPSSTR